MKITEQIILTDTDETKDTGWELSSYYVPVVVAPPSDESAANIIEYRFDEVHAFEIRPETQAGLISDALFDRLTEESILEHGDIWRRLAEL